MSGSGHDQRAGYKLIPQSVSEDSDLSEEELRSLYKDGFQIITKKHVYSSDRTNKKKKIQDHTHTSEMNIEKHSVKVNHVFQPQKRENGLSNEIELMSTGRKLSFGISIFTCFSIIGVFLILPCEWANCSCCVDKISMPAIWQRAVINVEFKGPVTLVNSTDLNNLNFLLLARGSIFADGPIMRTYTPSSWGGVVFAFNGLTGNLLWRKHFNKMPNEIDCSVFSVNNTFSKDCIIISYWSYITIVSLETGKVIWSTPFTNKFNSTNENFPFLVPDLNNDEVDDLLINKDAKIMTISGRSGTILSNDFKSLSTSCTEIKNIEIQNSVNLKFDCKMNNSFSPLLVSLKENRTLFNKFNEVLPQHHSFESMNPSFIHDYSIKVINEGVLCPRKCKAIVKIRNSKNKTVWSHESDYSYAMTPITFDLIKYTTGLFGFVFKIWEHEHEDTELKKVKVSQFNKEVTIGFIYERIVIVVFNFSYDEPIQTINLSYNPILQLYDAQKSIQPDPIAERHSLIVADVGKNGSYRIITYYSSFKDDRKDGYNYNFTDYSLKSYIQMYDLEKEIIEELKRPTLST